MQISNLEKTDLKGLSELYQQLIPNEVSIQKMEAVFERNRNNQNHIALVAKENGKLLGTLMAYICEMYFGQCKSFMVIEDFIVEKDIRGSGIGTNLMEAAEKKAKELNCSYIMLITDTDREESQNFYKKLGYSTDEYCAFKKKI
ncbi:GNAT family N-acetyltransferase [Desulforhopalus sp. IMCC35007]|uniref:GNAT family N-acetyltransferase n=1 Tax=Desulforhopalus sp. IMCC35007 TaxID=2569543 RepID=UPI0010AE60BE|nr:GNAT family N-acetyltransferase [Desulforhopalus sp. IMCC35007]TKB06871.1 GNAT family N-acetyltransferase [Desulforhopalus sp. IMCC35007]